MDELVPEAQKWLRQQPVENLYVGFAIVVFTTVFLVLFQCLKRSKSNTIILAGLSSSGKTTLFYQPQGRTKAIRAPSSYRIARFMRSQAVIRSQAAWCFSHLRDGSSHQGTVTSMEPNIDTFVLSSEAHKKGKVKPVRVVDVPGQSRLRPKLEGFLPQAAGLVFVVDALDFLPNCRATAEYLYDVLTMASVVKKKIPIIIVCNKTDKVTAHSKEFIRKQLEKEIDKLRTSRTAVSTADITDEYTPGIPGQPFTFSQCHNKVSTAEASGLTGEVSQIEQFIRENVKA